MTPAIGWCAGWTRNVPDGFDAQRAEDQFLHALRWCADALAGIGGTLVIEPLNRKESNQCIKGEPVASMRDSAAFLRQAWQRAA